MNGKGNQVGDFRILHASKQRFPSLDYDLSQENFQCETQTGTCNLIFSFALY